MEPTLRLAPFKDKKSSFSDFYIFNLLLILLSNINFHSIYSLIKINMSRNSPLIFITIFIGIGFSNLEFF